MLYSAAGRLDETEPLQWGSGAAVVVVMAADGYPGTPDKGGRIVLAPDTEVAHTIQAGTALDAEGHLVAAGGRVLGVVGTGFDLAAARDAAYAQVAATDFPSGFNRTDIALKAAHGQITLQEN